VKKLLLPVEYTLWFTIRNQGLIVPIFVEGIIINQWYLQQLQNEVILVARNVDIKFFQDIGSRVLVESVSRVLQMWVFLATMFTGHESLRLFSLVLFMRSCALQQPAHCPGVASRN
jgi:hypothetical protein